MDSRRGSIAAALVAAAVGMCGTAGAAHAFTPPVILPDTTPPVVPVPTGTLDQNSRTVRLTTAATDNGHGVLTYTWTAGDGTPPTSGALRSEFLHTYPALGTYTGTVTVTDPAGNRATQSFTVPVVDRTAPRLGHLAVESGVLATQRLRAVVAPTERVTATITATIRVGRHFHRLPPVRRRLLPGRFTGVRLLVRREVREAVARALRAGVPVRARASVVLVDQAGNTATAAGAAAVTG
jgi:hypothetical protein